MGWGRGGGILDPPVPGDTIVVRVLQETFITLICCPAASLLVWFGLIYYSTWKILCTQR